MAFNRGFLFAVVVVVVATAELMGNAAAATYVVGDSLGWTVPNGGPTAYTAWASQHVFRVGDVLVFNFPTGIHDVALVTKDAYDSCSSTNPIVFATLGPANFTLDSTGSHYYICTFAQHCSLGQKLAINVTSSSASAPPTPTPSSPPTTTPSPIPTPTPSPSPPMPSPPMPSPSGSSPSPGPAPSGGMATPPSSSSPGPAPSGTATPPSPPAPGSAPSSSTIPPGDMSPPPPPSSATIASISAPFVVFASIAVGLIMI